MIPARRHTPICRLITAAWQVMTVVNHGDHAKIQPVNLYIARTHSTGGNLETDNPENDIICRSLRHQTFGKNQRFFQGVPRTAQLRCPDATERRQYRAALFDR
jgi:hypothetical protein